MPKAKERERSFMIWPGEGVSSELPVCSLLLHCGDATGMEVRACANPKLPHSLLRQDGRPYREAWSRVSGSETPVPSIN